MATPARKQITDFLESLDEEGLDVVRTYLYQHDDAGQLSDEDLALIDRRSREVREGKARVLTEEEMWARVDELTAKRAAG